MNEHCTLTDQHCVPCRGGIPPLKGEQIQTLHKQLEAGWEIVDEHHLLKSFKFPDFRTALKFTNAVGEIAEEEGHHPDIMLSWGEVTITLWTHKIGGLSESDFILAAKADKAFEGAA